MLQVSLKSPDAVVTLPIYIGNIAVNLSPSRPMPTSPDHCGATIAASATGVMPSAPPAEEEPEEELCAGGVVSEEIPTKSHSQQDPSGQPVTMSPSAFSHAPGAALPPSHRRPDASAPLFCVSTGATIPFFTEGNVTPVPTSCSLILPPEYSSWDYPHGQFFKKSYTLVYKHTHVQIYRDTFGIMAETVFPITVVALNILFMFSPQSAAAFFLYKGPDNAKIGKILCI